MSSRNSRSVVVDTSRYYDNKFNDYSEDCGNIVKPDTQTIHDEFKESLSVNINRLLQVLEGNKKHWTHNDDYSVYTGTSGIAYMFYQYGKHCNEPAYISKAIELLRVCVNKFRSRREITFLCGLAGPLALLATFLHLGGNKEETKSLIAKLKSLSILVINDGSDVPDELLYGRGGYLYSLLYLNSNISPPPIEDELIKQVISCIIKSGNVYASSFRYYDTPIMYSWHDTEYIGGAHGLLGILYVLLQARSYLTQAQLERDVKPALHYLQKLQFPSGNFPSNTGSNSDKLIHWCHGAPGACMVYCLAHEVFQDESFLQTALQCGEVIWERGLLKKGYGICHGVSGNAYTFLYLFQKTKDIKHLYRACRFAEWCFHYGTHQNRTPDRPYSLFEGLAGVIYFLIDLKQPNLAKFPAYSV